MTAPTFLERVADRVQGATDNKYVEFKENVSKVGKIGTITGVAALITAVAFLILGIALCATGNLGGLVPIFLSLPLFYAGYNGAALGSNIQKIAENPKTVHGMGGFGELDKEKLKVAMKKGTLGMDCIINNAIEKLDNKN